MGGPIANEATRNASANERVTVRLPQISATSPSPMPLAAHSKRRTASELVAAMPVARMAEVRSKLGQEATRATEITRGVGGVQKVVRIFEIVTENELAEQLPRAGR